VIPDDMYKQHLGKFYAKVGDILEGEFSIVWNMALPKLCSIDLAWGSDFLCRGETNLCTLLQHRYFYYCTVHTPLVKALHQLALKCFLCAVLAKRNTLNVNHSYDSLRSKLRIINFGPNVSRWL
jgi:hypothetical protein